MAAQPDEPPKGLHTRRHLQGPSRPFSPSPSSEADDERSVSDSASWMSHEDLPAPSYPGEDTRLTSSKELTGWYCYGWAAEVFAICGLGSFIPITLEQLARERGVLLSDRTTPCRSALNNSSPHAHSAFAKPIESKQCIVYIFGHEINTASFAMYAFSISVLVQSVVIISMSGAADHGNYRKFLLLTFAVVGAASTMAFFPIVPQVYILGAILAIIANTCFGASFVLLNSFLPVLVRRHPSIQEDPDGTPEQTHYRLDRSHESLSASIDSIAAREILPVRPKGIQNLEVPLPLATRALQLSTRISSRGIAVGYGAGVFVQSACILIIFLTGSKLFSLRLVLFIIGCWWLLFTIPAALWLRPRPGPPLPDTKRRSSGRRSILGYVTYSWKGLYRTARRAGRLKDMLLFLGAWFMLSDGLATVSGTAVLFAKTQLEMGPAALALINVVATISGVIGALTWAPLSKWLGLKPVQTIMACVCLFELVPLYGLLGYIPFVANWGVIGLQQPWEMYPLGALYGFILGGLNSYCRSLFGELIPPGSEAAFYALYAITDKGSSIFGPAIVGRITDATGSIRPAFWFLAVLIFIPLPLINLVDVDRGRREGEAMVAEYAAAEAMLSEQTPLLQSEAFGHDELSD